MVKLVFSLLNSYPVFIGKFPKMEIISIIIELFVRDPRVNYSSFLVVTCLFHLGYDRGRGIQQKLCHAVTLNLLNVWLFPPYMSSDCYYRFTLLTTWMLMIVTCLENIMQIDNQSEPYLTTYAVK